MMQSILSSSNRLDDGLTVGGYWAVWRERFCLELERTQKFQNVLSEMLGFRKVEGHRKTAHKRVPEGHCMERAQFLPKKNSSRKGIQPPVLIDLVQKITSTKCGYMLSITESNYSAKTRLAFCVCQPKSFANGMFSVRDNKTKLLIANDSCLTELSANDLQRTHRGV